MKLRINYEGRSKLGLSFALLIYAITAAVIAKNPWIAIAMIASTLGDTAIMASRGVFNDEKWRNSFPLGVVLFANAHCAYISAMDTKISRYVSTLAVLTLMVVVITAKLTMGNQKKEHPMMFAYAIILIMNMVNGFFYRPLAGIGGILFIVSDSILALFEKKSPKWQVAIWATYVPAQICLITSFVIK